MSGATRKTEVGPIDGTPVKRMFWSIISDYDLKTGLCELIDNALDLWKSGKRQSQLKIEIDLNVARQIITIADNAGGVKQDELELLIVPGGSRNDPAAHVIGIFGVGSKRAGIALGENVRMQTRFRRESTFEIEVTKTWLETDDWHLAYYEVPEIRPNTTIVEISHLRKPITETDIEDIRTHLGETYDWFIHQGCGIELNGKPVLPLSFDTWAFPTGHNPKCAQFELDLGDGDPITVEITGGLIRDRIAEEENYGVYFYCNERLIVKELRDREVGYFASSEAGVPHPDASLCRVVVRLEGEAQHMPWNSSKSGINFGHPAFTAIRPTLIQLTSHFSSLSRRLKHDWEGAVFPFNKGKIEEIEPGDLSSRHPLILPSLPKVNRPRVEKLKTKNRKQIHEMPWTLGLVEAMDAVEIIARQKYETGNRIALILLDSNFEIALKEFIVHREDIFPPKQFNRAYIQQLFESRANVITAVDKAIGLPGPLLTKVKHFYGIRNKLIHERATVEPTNTDIRSYKAAIQKILKLLFDLRL